ncbi:hypothetical protein [Neobacillus sp. NPDC093127]|uniref:hypothetical protein n=1 Tax=Neobacillus sp. NPDC093127 TaxID=3364296 RepID=UPI00381D40E1
MVQDMRSSPPELASGPFFYEECKDAPAYAVIRMKRTLVFYTYRVYKGGTAKL